MTLTYIKYISIVCLCWFRALKSSQHSLCSLLIVDTPGFQNPKFAKRDRGATFEELCHNYTQERLQTLFHERTFVQELERYKEVQQSTQLQLSNYSLKKQKTNYGLNSFGLCLAELNRC